MKNESIGPAEETGCVITPSHPAMSTRVEDEELELAHDFGHSSHSSSDAEQEQGLLGGWKEVDAEQAQERSGTRRRKWTWLVWAAVIAAVLSALAISVGFVLGLGSLAKEGSQDGRGVQTNDYILEYADWDFDAPPQRREYTWTVRDQEHNPDGIFRPMLLVNNQFPGPMVRANEGDVIVVHIDNQAVNATSIHWHGIYQNSTPHMDGTVGISQCPIAPGGRFTYEFTISGQSGTYWWHAHHGVQSSDGAHGPFIIHNRKEKQRHKSEYDSDRVVLISDHYHDLSSALLWQYLKPDMENTEPVPEGGLINGRSVRSCDEYPHRKCDNRSSHVGLATFDLAKNQRHRLRLINVGAFAEFQVQIDEHELAVMEVDGTDVTPVNYHRININPAQRYSVLLDTSVSTASSFWFRARMITRCFTDPPKTLNPDVNAIVRYNGGADSDKLPSSIDWAEQLEQECRDMNTSDLTPVEIVPAPAEADAFFYLRANFEIGAYRLARGVFNASSWRANARSPTLLRSIDGIKEENASFIPADVSSASNNMAFVNDVAFDLSREMVIQTTGIQTVDILFSNFDDGNHPLHLHGYKYFVLAQGHGYPALKSPLDDISKENLEPLYLSLDLSNPLRRDTASVEAYGWILIRIVADNPGIWPLHCHNSWHTEAGLLMQLLTRSDELAKLDLPDANRALCAAEGIEKGGPPQDEDYRDLAK